MPIETKTKLEDIAPKKKSNFIFGDVFGGYMSRVSMRTQYEGTMIGCTLILLSLVYMIINWIFFTNMTFGWKAFYVINALCGMMILWSSVVTTFQQYQSYREVEAVTNLLSNDKKVKGGYVEW